MESEDKLFQPHHVQHPLCTTRLHYRRGRKLTAVKVYTINDESAHLLVFGVPSLNLRVETKALFTKFGKLLQFNLTTDYPNEQFTETYHALYERIQSARIAKKMLDGKNFYGGSLHICYAPELENLDQLRAKLLQRKKDISFRLQKNNLDERNLTEIKEHVVPTSIETQVEIYREIINEVPEDTVSNQTKLDMSEENVIRSGSKRKKETSWEEMKGKLGKIKKHHVDIVDFTSVDKEVLSNINEALNYNKFGSEVVRKVPDKSLNKIVFNIPKR